MNLNRKRHKTLKLLSVSRIQFESGQSDSKTKFGMSFDELQKELKCDRTKCELIFSPLYSNEEIKYTNVDVEGLISTRKGLTAFSEKKYLKENDKIIVNWLRNFVQIVIPVLALLIAYVSLTTKLESLKTQSDKELQVVKKSMLEQKERIKELENKTKIHPNHQKNDSL
ncbi:hypothetical protein [Jejuia pallidilutea]|uniref:Uncharacterized protein n=2 Tax=Jejuia pallidilutea TaxID=504487 RepID=A0A090VWG9_9FLAO|nr:hypothetical protein [Jejuia pallidilutea]GAL69085.1 hypothetical protein JCM19301_2957 [Jejuia pallidilutea]GAL73320.1 hypothetical protein JCM19302_2568 [Jejuia pallidilutea]